MLWTVSLYLVSKSTLENPEGSQRVRAELSGSLGGSISRQTVSETTVAKLAVTKLAVDIVRNFKSSFTSQDHYHRHYGI